MGQLYIDEIINNSDNQIFITSDSGAYLHGFINSELTFGASANYDTADASAALEDGSKLVDKVGRNLAGKSMVMNTSATTKLSWQSSAMDGMSLEILMLSTGPNDDILNRAKQIYEFLLPKERGNFLTPPTDYNSNIGDPGVKNAVSVAIGNWFEGHGFVMTNANFTVSKEKIGGDGHQPLYISVTCELVPAYVMHKKEVLSMFT